MCISAVAVVVHEARLSHARRLRAVVHIMPPAMSAQLKAMRAQRRRDGRADFNAALTAAVRH
eukprot:2219159-Pyramimonas_sp.AAC.1